MTSVDMQRSPDIRHDVTDCMRGSRFNGLPDTFWDSFNRQDKLRDDLPLLWSARNRFAFGVHKKTGARPDDFDLSYPHAEDVLHRRKLNNDRFIPRSHDAQPPTPKLADGEQSQKVPASQSCGAKCAVADFGTFNSIQIDHPVNADSHSHAIGNCAIAANPISAKSNAFIFPHSQTLKNT